MLFVCSDLLCFLCLLLFFASSCLYVPGQGASSLFFCFFGGFVGTQDDLVEGKGVDVCGDILRDNTEVSLEDGLVGDISRFFLPPIQLFVYAGGCLFLIGLQGFGQAGILCLVDIKCGICAGDGDILQREDAL